MLKSKITEVAAPKEEIQFPCLVRFKDKFTVLVREEGMGTVIESSDPNHPIGWYSNQWNFPTKQNLNWEILPKGTKVEIVVG